MSGSALLRAGPAEENVQERRLLLHLPTTSASLLCSAGFAVQVDSYSYAVLCWEMLTGQVPWQELQTPMQIIFQVGVMHQVGRER